MVRTRLKLAATLTVVVLALTGFQTSSSGGHGGGSGSGKSSSRSGKSKGGSDGSSGGGCSSSKKKNDDYDAYDGNGSGGSNNSTYTPSPTSSPTADVYATVVDCVEPAQKKRKGKPARKADTTATVEITSGEYETKTFRVVVGFMASPGTEADRAEAVVTVERRGKKTFEIAMRHPKVVGKVTDCYVQEVREVPQPSSPTPTASGSPSSSS